MEKISGQKIFLLDAVGAFVSIIFLSFLYSFDDFFGMPKSVIKIFLGIATAFFVYSTTTYFIKPINWQYYLKIIATLNICYCLFTFYHLLQNLDTLTLYGHTYFIAEILVILILSTYELKNARKTTTR
ncbi:hypothetical protein P872_14185 [Rhodonellum psychrophilum GCM71 = DSM 17998]|uniref:Uncharacterized protein n=2 Tax=Rhodonellum TaxID=336827 RepID=U5BWB7_9BACT|nr:hypothetical protein P872_14185 [Rhodonellum psychrophilum GCM71 = DSM 17998]SDZ58156.1 hypothetical protein SAMN05444412_1335 [Rhodonellum ikkaensis]